MDFQDRYQAGSLLAQKLEKYAREKTVVFCLPRGGVVTGFPIAKALKAPLDLLIAHKIGHPHQPEYAIAAISEGGFVLENASEVQMVDPAWYEEAKKRETEEIKRRRATYLKGQKPRDLEGTIAIVVDDGIATGLTMKAAILSLKARKPKKIVVAVPVAPKMTVEALETMADEVIALVVDDDWAFRGAIGAYYLDFTQTSDQEVISLLEESTQWIT